MSFKIYLDDYSSLVECELTNSKSVTSMSEADLVVNPSNKFIFNKTIVITLPIEIPLEELAQFNTIISRFPIGYNIDVEPYEIPENRDKVNKDDYSLLILSKELIKNLDYGKLVNSSSFLIGIDECIDNCSTLIGQLILKSKIEDL